MIPYSSSISERYRYISPLATGGQATLYQAFDEVREQSVALKCWDLDSSPWVRRAYESELEFISKLYYPRIVLAYDHHFHEQMPMLSMEYIDGHSLAWWRNSHFRDHPIPLTWGCVLGMQICDALGYLHYTAIESYGGIIHRDLSPSNIMLTKTGQVKLIDFATAQRRRPMEPGGPLKGKLRYAAPEEFDKGAPVTHRSDIFSLGVLLYELFSGTNLFVAETNSLTIQRVLSAPIPLLHHIAPVPRQLSDCIHRALERDSEHRYTSVREWSADLHHFISSSELDGFYEILQTGGSMHHPSTWQHTKFNSSEDIRTKNFRMNPVIALKY